MLNGTQSNPPPPDQDLKRCPPEIPPPARAVLHDVLMTFCMHHFDLGEGGSLFRGGGWGLSEGVLGGFGGGWGEIEGSGGK